jgi:hypothetical protein
MPFVAKYKPVCTLIFSLKIIYKNGIIVITAREIFFFIFLSMFFEVFSSEHVLLFSFLKKQLTCKF